MGTLNVDQITPSGALVQDIDTKLSPIQKRELLLAALTDATFGRYAGVPAARLGDLVIFYKQITHMGFPHPEFKKRIQIPKSWPVAYRQAVAEGLTPHFVGIYRYDDVTIFVDYDPHTYAARNANNSSAWVYTNDLFQAQTLGQFSREDKNGNHITSVRADLFAGYLAARTEERHPHLDVFAGFNREFLTGDRLEWIEALEQMHDAKWKDRNQGEWPGFYLEYRLDAFTRTGDHTDLVQFQKEKRKGLLDYDLLLLERGKLDFYGDLKASDIIKHESPGNDAEDLKRCIEQYGRFWYVVYEHRTWHARDNGDLATIAWNEWRRDKGYVAKKGYNELSYARRFKEAVRFERMRVLEINAANFGVVLGSFKQGRQPDGASRALKVMINKRNIDNFLIYSESVEVPAP
ncbi:hypothetical protein [Isoptericola sp. G70]|uniref:hypothetical protein n=1 Tax=Isoptericola sp. G70 TaxID=3376633 RepID=UPI003A80C7C9